jgi:hypothetical protein
MVFTLSTIMSMVAPLLQEEAGGSSNSDLMLALVVLFGFLILFVVSLVVRFRNTNNTMNLMQQLQDESDDYFHEEKAKRS